MTTPTRLTPATDKRPCPACPPQPPTAWNHPCRCRHIHARHTHHSHPPVAYPGGTCHGSNLAGRCRWTGCGCPTFTPAAPTAPPPPPGGTR